MKTIREFTVGGTTFFVDENNVTHVKYSNNEEVHDKWFKKQQEIIINKTKKQNG
jgi:hypothetical protein